MKNFTLLSQKILIMITVVFSMYLPGGLSAEEQDLNKEPNTSVKSEGFPKIQFYESAYDFGKSSEDKTLEHIFSFKNTGTGNLQIIQVKAG